MKVKTLVPVNIDSIFDIETVEADSILADGRGERVLEESHLIIVDIDIGEYVLEGGGEDITRLKEVVDTGSILSFDDALLIMRTLAIDFLGQCLIDRDREDEFVVIFTSLHLVLHPRHLLEFGSLEFLGGDVVEGKGNLLIFVILIIVAVV